MVMLASPVLDMRECMADMGGAQEIQRARFYWSLLCPATWSSATPVLKSDPITYTSGEGRTQIDFVLFRKTFHKHVGNLKVIPGEEIAKQYYLLVCEFRADISPLLKKKVVPRPKT